MNLVNKNKFVKGNINDFADIKGYFIGRFLGQRGFPELETDEVEIAWKTLPTEFGIEKEHFHKKGVEVNIVISGGYKVLVNGGEVEIRKGEFLVVYPETKLKNLSAEANTQLIVVKSPSVEADKFNIE